MSHSAGVCMRFSAYFYGSAGSVENRKWILCAWAPGGRLPGNVSLLNHFKVYLVSHSTRVSRSLSIFTRSEVESTYVLETRWAESLEISPLRKGPRVNTQHLRRPREGKCCVGLSNFYFTFMLAPILKTWPCATFSSKLHANTSFCLNIIWICRVIEI